MRRSGLKLVGVAAITLLIAAACGGGGGKKTTGGTTTTAGGGDIASVVRRDPVQGPAGTGLTRGVTSDTIKVGCIIQGASFPNADDGFKARFQRATREGLPGGRKIQFLPCQDDGSNAQNNLQIARRLVESDKV